MDSENEPLVVNRLDPAAIARFVTLTNRGMLAGLCLYGAVLLVAYLFHIPGFSGAWVGLCGGGSGLITPGAFFLVLAGGPAVVYLYTARKDPEILADSRLQYHLFNGIFAIGGSYFLVLGLSLLMQVLMQFPPDELVWISLQGCMFFAFWIAIRWQCSRHFAVPMQWIPTKFQAVFFLGFISIVLTVLFLWVYITPVVSFLSGHG
ncbi:MAG: hypothetical protein Q8R70_12990 [Methanoregula sp.]|nr:hypothetical protein [Methanoregula sp.]